MRCSEGPGDMLTLGEEGEEGREGGREGGNRKAVEHK